MTADPGSGAGVVGGRAGGGVSVGGQLGARRAGGAVRAGGGAPAHTGDDRRPGGGRAGAGLIAQTETAVADWPISVPGLDRRVEAAADALWAALESLIGYGGDPKARR